MEYCIKSNIKTNKKSLLDAANEAYNLSISFPDRKYYVLDKKQHRTEVYSLEYCVRNKMMWDGYHCVMIYLNGEVVGYGNKMFL